MADLAVQLFRMREERKSGWDMQALYKIAALYGGVDAFVQHHIDLLDRADLQISVRSDPLPKKLITIRTPRSA